MPRLFAFLRAINVGGHNVTMAELRRLFEKVGCKEVVTFIASGNVIFASGLRDIGGLREKLENQLRQALGYEVTVFLRTEPELAAMARYQPFRGSQMQSAQALNVGLLSGPLSPEATKSVMAMKSDIDDFHVHGREVYWLCKTSQSDSKFSNVRFEKAVKARATWRNVNTIVRLAAKYLTK